MTATSLRRAGHVLLARRGIVADLPSLGRYARLEAGAAGGLVPLRVSQLGGRTVWLRPGTSDADTFWATFFHRYHLPPPEIGEPELILDLGANIGLTMAHFAELYPRARVVGVELDAENAALARRNVEPWGDRCEVVQAAVAPEDGEVRYHRHANQAGYNVVPDGRPEGDTPAPAVSLATLIGDRAVDYLKMDIEGSEHSVLKRATGWAQAVKAIQVEAHFGYSREECAEDLRALGFETRIHPRHPASVVGIRADICYKQT